uniref:Uncharacterized protein n=1 Tax=Rhizophagus irregularis (strain DAOM 181602 / DAOM 197198 / MUCL 43194) TaxID=747089 RepID=U9UQM1_RHIID
MGTLDVIKLPLGYSTGYPPALGKCNHYHEVLNEQEQCQILICSHGIQKNVDSFLNRLNSSMNELIDKDIENIEGSQDRENNEDEPLNNNEVENIHINLNERLQKMDTNNFQKNLV